MQEISSSNNKILKQAASLSEKKYRDSLGMYLIEGPNFVRDAVLYGGRLRFIFTRAGSLNEELCEIADLAEERGTAVFSLTDEAFSKLSDTKTSQGIVAVAEKRSITEEEFFKEEGSNILVLDKVQDPGNLGTMLRSAEALGFSGVLLIKGCTDVYGPKLVRAAAGSLMRLPVFFSESSEAALALLKKHGKKPFAAVMNGEVNCFDADLSRNAAVVIGNEGNGVSKEIIDASTTISIPMTGDMESLNAGLAAGIIMYESLRQKLSLK